MLGNAPQAASRSPLTSPKAWWEEQDRAEAAQGAAAAPTAPAFPGPGWPSAQSIDYMTKLVTLGLILLAVPWLLGQLLSSPREGSRRAASVAGIGRVVA